MTIPIDTFAKGDVREAALSPIVQRVERMAHHIAACGRAEPVGSADGLDSAVRGLREIADDLERGLKEARS